MQKNSLLALIGTSAILAGCNGLRNNSSMGITSSTDYQRSSEKYSTGNNIKGNMLRRVTQKDFRYSLEGVVLHERMFYTEKNAEKRDGELNFYLLARDEHTREINPEEKQVSRSSLLIYVPEKVLAKSGKEAHKLKLRKDGKYAASANITKFDPWGIQVGTFRENEEDAKFNLKTIAIGLDSEGNPQEWYVPAVEEEETSNLGALPFYFIPVKNTKQVINNDGSITLDSPDGIWRPKALSTRDYNDRPIIKALEEKIRTEEKSRQEQNPGQALEPTE